MEPNRLENEFKDKLEQRTIQPSAMAWDRLDAMLSVTEEKKQPEKKYWMYIAAGFLGFLLVGALLLKLEGEAVPTGNINNAVVNTGQPASNEKPEKSTEAGVLEVNESIITAPVSTEAVALQQKAPVKQQKIEKAAVKQDNKVIFSNVTHQEAVAVQVHSTPEQESEELLASSLSEDSAPKKRSGIKVDANSLLSSVEGELENNFRNEVLQKVVKNYNSVKTSVANRNYQ